MLKLYGVLIVCFVPFISLSQVELQHRISTDMLLHYQAPWDVTVMNYSGAAINVYLTGKILDDNNNQVLLTNSRVVRLKPGVNVFNRQNLNTKDINIYSPDFSKYINGSGFLPPGRYIVCTYVNYDEGAKMAHEVCTPHELKLSPPELIHPENNAQLNSKELLLRWSPPNPFPICCELSYDLKVVEKLPGQSEIEAIQNNPAIHEAHNLIASSYLYPQSTIALVAGKVYVWQVYSRLDDLFSGSSQIWSFIIKNDLNTSAPTGQYAVLKDQIDQSFVTASTHLSFTLPSPNGKIIEKAAIVMRNGEETPILTLDHKSTRQTLALGDYRLKNGERYTLKVTTTTHEIYFLSFEKIK